MGEKETFTPEQLYAMFLTKLKMTAEASLQTKVVDFVLSVSSCNFLDFFFIDKGWESFVRVLFLEFCKILKKLVILGFPPMCTISVVHFIQWDWTF